jgi:hypothetical protein
LQFLQPRALCVAAAQGGRCGTTKHIYIMAIQSLDLTKQPPRSARVRLGGYVILARCLDKGRASINGKNGEYHFACPLDQHVLEFLGVDAEALKKELEAGKGDGEIIEWIQANAKHKRTGSEIAAWTAYHNERAPSDVEGREYLNGIHAKVAPKREDISTWFDVLDVDDFVSYGGKA